MSTAKPEQVPPRQPRITAEPTPRRRGNLLGQRYWGAKVDGHQIRVVCSWLVRAQLWIDGTCVDTRTPLLAFNGRVPLLTGRLPGGGHEIRLVEVYADSPLVLSVLLHVGRRRITCDRLLEI